MRMVHLQPKIGLGWTMVQMAQGPDRHQVHPMSFGMRFNIIEVRGTSIHLQIPHLLLRGPIPPIQHKSPIHHTQTMKFNLGKDFQLSQLNNVFIDGSYGKVKVIPSRCFARSVTSRWSRAHIPHGQILVAITNWAQRVQTNMASDYDALIASN